MRKLERSQKQARESIAKFNRQAAEAERRAEELQNQLDALR